MRGDYMLAYAQAMKAKPPSSSASVTAARRGERATKPGVIGPAIESKFVVDPVALFGGPSATIAASVPARLADAIRAQAGKGEFSRVVTIALARWLVDRNLAAYVESFEADHGPLDPVVVARIEAALNR